MLVLTAACAYWMWLLSDLRHHPIDFVILAAITIACGIVGHLLYAYVLPWRVTVVVSNLVLFLVVCELGTGSVAGGLGSLTQISNFFFYLPVDFFVHRRGWADGMSFWLPMLAGIVICTAAHPIKPSLPTAIITAIGISMWFGVAALIAINAG